MLSFAQVASRVIDLLTSQRVALEGSQQYPGIDIATDDLPYVVIRNPVTTRERLSVRRYGGYQVIVKFDTDILIIKLDEGQANLTAAQENECWSYIPLLFNALEVDHQLTTGGAHPTDKIAVLELASEATIVRFNPSTDSNRHSYGGIHVQLQARL